MKKLILLICLFLPIVAFADSIDELIARYPRATVSVLVKDNKTDRVIYARNPHQLMVPASVTKSFVAYAALKHLGADFVYKTQIFMLKNDVYLKFSGDPSLSLKDLQQLLEQIPENTKHIYIDDSSFDQNYYGDGWALDDTKFCFSAPLSAIIIDENCFAAVIEPNARLKHSKLYTKLENKLIAKDDPSCAPNLHVNANGNYELNGCINKEAGPIALSIAYQNPRDLIKNILKYKKISFKKTPNNSKLIAEIKSKPLNILVKIMMKESNNIYANALLKTIGGLYYQSQGSFENGVKAVAEITAIDQMRMVDGSGTSRYNLIAPDQLMELYEKAQKDKKIYPYFYASLPIAGVDGSLEKTFADHPHLHGMLRAKTGSMKTVYSLAGYIDEDIIFAVLVNGFIGSRNEAGKLVEEILALQNNPNKESVNGK